MCEKRRKKIETEQTSFILIDRVMAQKENVGRSELTSQKYCIFVEDL